MQCVINGRNGGRVFIYVRSTRANRTPNNLERLQIVTTKISCVPGTDYINFLSHLLSFTLPKRYKKIFRVDHFNMDHFKVMLLKTICNDDY